MGVIGYAADPRLSETRAKPAEDELEAGVEVARVTLLDIGRFRDRRFSASAVAVLAVFFGFGGLLLLLYELGGALGVAFLGSVMTARYRAELDGLAGVPGEAREGLPAAAEIAVRAGGDAGAAILVAAQQAFIDGLSVTLVVAAAVTAAIAVTALAFMPRDRSLGAAPTTVEA